MKKIILSIAIALIALSSYAADVTKDIKVSSFDGLDISSVFDVTVTKSKNHSLSITVDPELEEYVIATVVDHTLILKLDGNRMPERLKRNLGKRTLSAQVSMHSLENLEMSGATTFRCNDTFDVVDFEGDISGASKIESLNIKGNEADFDISGATNVKINVEVRDFGFDCSGASKVTITGEIKRADIELSGASNLTLLGEAENVDIEVSGASNLEAEDLLVKVAKVDLSGASKVTINVNKSLSAEISGASTLYYKAPEDLYANINSLSRNSTIKKIK